ncbi:hypothetical protein WMY93_017747 [Mugilogobius chulae]|uniref:Uncharacterized protein n=1 Tax=Mugilogobius chulae TaxID=88201 RepID=A0AAW0NZA7_9GOBI
MAVHLTRPKSSKGRRRSTKTINFFQNNDVSGDNPQRNHRGSRVSPGFGVNEQDTQVNRPQSRPEMRHSGLLSQDQVEQNQLGVSAPGGKSLNKRFQQRFNSSDTLLRVRTSAEATYGEKFGENATIETMEIPRRSFTDMSLTLLQCGISDKSVLCIFQPQDE